MNNCNTEIWLFANGLYIIFSLIHAGHQPDEPMGFSGDLQQQYILFWD